jgi:hypothetical protein
VRRLQKLPAGRAGPRQHVGQNLTRTQLAFLRRLFRRCQNGRKGCPAQLGRTSVEIDAQRFPRFRGEFFALGQNLVENKLNRLVEMGLFVVPHRE